MIRVFFDASVIFSAIYSNTGGSYKLLTLLRKRKITGITSQNVIEELERNLNKLKSFNLKKLYKFIKDNNLIVCQQITTKEIKPLLPKINIKDAHVAAGALLTKCHYLVTLDKIHLNNRQVKKNITKTKIVSPRKLLQELLKI